MCEKYVSSEERTLQKILGMWFVLWQQISSPETSKKESVSNLCIVEGKRRTLEPPFLRVVLRICHLVYFACLTLPCLIPERLCSGCFCFILTTILRCVPISRMKKTRQGGARQLARGYLDRRGFWPGSEQWLFQPHPASNIRLPTCANSPATQWKTPCFKNPGVVISWGKIPYLGLVLQFAVIAGPPLGVFSQGNDRRCFLSLAIIAFRVLGWRKRSVPGPTGDNCRTWGRERGSWSTPNRFPSTDHVCSYTWTRTCQ